MRSIIIAVFVALLMMPAASMARRSHMCKLDGKWWQTPSVVNQMGLTKKQVQGLNKKYIKHKKKVIDYRSKIQKMELDTAPLLMEENVDEKKLDKKLGKIRTERIKLHEEYDDWFVEMRMTITMDQYMNACAMFGQGKKPRKKPAKKKGWW